MSTVNAAGVGSGLDVSSIVTQLMTIEKQPLTQLQNKLSDTNAQISAFGQLQSALSSLQTATSNLNTSDKFSAYKASVSSDAGFTVSAGAKAVAGSSSVTVKALAQGQKLLSSVNATDMTSALTSSTGSLSFTTQSGASNTVSIASGASLKDIRDAVNTANIGITASIVQNGSSYNLQFSSSTTGTANSFSVAASGDSALNSFTYDTSASSNSMKQTVAAQDASVDIDGVNYTSSTNTLTGAMQDVTLTLTKASSSTTSSVTIAQDTDTIASNIQSFITAYNKVNSLSRSLTSYDTTTKTGGVLNSDFTATSMQFGIRNALQTAVGGSGALQTLSDIGVTFAKDGSLSLDSTKLTKVLSDPSKDISSLFVSGTGTTGLMSRFSTYLDNLNGTSGTITSRVSSLNNKIKLTNTDIDNMNTRLSQVEARYTAQFNALDTTMSQLNSTSSYLTTQLAKL